MRRLLLLGTSALALACSNGGNPFSAVSPSRPPAADVAILFMSGSWSADANAPREIFAIGPDGSKPQQLRTCARAAEPCDILQVAPAPIASAWSPCARRPTRRLAPRPSISWI